MGFPIVPNRTIPIVCPKKPIVSIENPLKSSLF